MMTESERSSEIELNKDLIDSLFLLKKSSDSSTISLEADFSPPSCKDRQAHTDSLKSLPIFNFDGKHYTPSFIVQLDKPKYIENQQAYLLLHHRKTSEMSEQKNLLFVPKPSKNNSFCCICRTPFEDYLTHINSPKHQFLMKNSDYHERINDLCSKFRGKDSQKILSIKRKDHAAKIKIISKATKNRKLKTVIISKEQPLFEVAKMLI